MTDEVLKQLSNLVARGSPSGAGLNVEGLPAALCDGSAETLERMSRDGDFDMARPAAFPPTEKDPGRYDRAPPQDRRARVVPPPTPDVKIVDSEWAAGIRARATVKRTLASTDPTVTLAGCVTTLRELRDSTPVRSSVVTGDFRRLALCTFDGVNALPKSYFMAHAGNAAYQLVDYQPERSR